MLEDDATLGDNSVSGEESYTRPVEKKIDAEAVVGAVRQLMQTLALTRDQADSLEAGLQQLGEDGTVMSPSSDAEDGSVSSSDSPGSDTEHPSLATEDATIGRVSASSEGAKQLENLEPPPDAPSGLSVALAWGPSVGASGYNLKRSVVSGGPYSTIASGIVEPSYTDRTVAHGTTYYYVVSALSPAGESPNSAEMSFRPVAAPSPPSRLIAMPGVGVIDLNWDEPAGAVSYTIKRGEAPQGPFIPVASSLKVSYFVDDSALVGATHYYVATARNESGESADSSVTSARLVAPPDAPLNVSAAPGSGKVTLTWDASVDATSYAVKRGSEANGRYRTVATGITVLGYTDTAVSNGATYHYVVSAHNTGGESPDSREAIARPVAPAAPPLGLAGSPGDTRVTLTWRPVMDAAAYCVKRSQNTSGPYTVVAASVSGESYTDVDISNGVTYYYVVSSLNAGGESINSAEVSARPLNRPRTPAGVVAAAMNGQVAVLWPAAPGATGYNLKRSTISGGPYTAIGSGLLGTTYMDSSVRNGVTYYYVVSAVNSGGESAPTSEMAATPMSPPPAPPGGQISPGSGEVALKWDPVSSADSYSIKRSTVPGGPYTTLASGVVETSYLDSAVSNGAIYYYVVSAANVGGEGYDSTEMSARPVGAPAVPTGLTAVPGNGLVVLNWLPLPGATSYNIKRTSRSGGPYTPVATDVTSTTYSDSIVKNGVVYFYVVSASNFGGESADSAEASAEPVAEPEVPRDLAAVPGNGQVSLSWSPAPGATSYTIKRSTVRGGRYTVLVSGLRATHYVDLSAVNGTTCYYVVVGANAGGHSADSIEASAKPVSPPSVPGGLSAAAGNGRVSLSWSPSYGATSYNVKRSASMGGTIVPVAVGVDEQRYTDTTVNNGSTGKPAAGVTVTLVDPMGGMAEVATTAHITMLSLPSTRVAKALIRLR